MIVVVWVAKTCAICSRGVDVLLFGVRARLATREVAAAPAAATLEAEPRGVRHSWFSRDGAWNIEHLPVHTTLPLQLRLSPHAPLPSWCFLSASRHVAIITMYVSLGKLDARILLTRNRCRRRRIAAEARGTAGSASAVREGGRICRSANKVQLRMGTHPSSQPS